MIGAHGFQDDSMRTKMGRTNGTDNSMELRFWIDPETSLPHIFNHGVTEQNDEEEKTGVSRRLE